MTTTIVLPDAAALAEHAAREVLADAAAAIRARGYFTFVLSGGNTPRRLYEKLASEPLVSQLPWDRTHVFWGDERHVPPDHAESDYRMARESMLSKVPIPAANVHRIEAELADAAEAARRYEATIRDTFAALGQPASATPSFDLVLLGLGADGHTASLFPGSPALDEQSRWVASPWVEKFNTYRITLTPPILNASAHVIFLASGTDKADAVWASQHERPEPRRRPSQAIRPSNDRLTWLLDTGAASRLDDRSTPGFSA